MTFISFHLSGTFGDNFNIDPYLMFIDNSLIQNRTGSYKVCVRQMHFEELNEYEDVSMLPKEVPGRSTQGKASSFYIVHCVVMLDKPYYSDEGCTVWSVFTIK